MTCAVPQVIRKKESSMEIDPEVKKNIFESNDTWSASGLLFASRKPLLHSMLVGCGYETRCSTNYDFNGFPAERRSL